MNKVIRTARIAAQPVVLPIHVDRDVVDLPFVAEDDEFTEADFEAAQAEDVEASSEFTALGDQAEVVEEEPKLSMEEVEALIAERVQEVETRLLQEKAQEIEQEKAAAHQAGLEAGQSQGYADGHAAGLAEGQAQSQDEITRFQALISQVAERWDPIFKSADLDVVQLAFAVARKIVGSVVNAHEDLVLEAVGDCLEHVQDVTKLTICVNPDDLRIVRANRTLWQEAYERIESMTIEADETIERGGCVIETPAGDIDGQISSRLEKLQTAILERLQGMPQETVPDVSRVVAGSGTQEEVDESGEAATEDSVEAVAPETALEQDVLEAETSTTDEVASDGEEASVSVDEHVSSGEGDSVISETDVVDETDVNLDAETSDLQDEGMISAADDVNGVETTDAALGEEIPDDASNLEDEIDSIGEETSVEPQSELSNLDASDDVDDGIESGASSEEGLNTIQSGLSDAEVSDDVSSEAGTERASDENSLDMTQSDLSEPDVSNDVNGAEIADDAQGEDGLEMTQNNLDEGAGQNEDVGEQVDEVDQQENDSADRTDDATTEDGEEQS